MCSYDPDPPNETDVALKILHTADWHLGRRFPTFEEADELVLMRARIEAVERLLSVAEQHQVDAVLCAGDLFDDPFPKEEVHRALADVLRRHGSPERPIVLLPGNHDPLVGGSVWNRSHAFRQQLPSWVHVIDEPAVEVPLAKRAVVYARPCTSRAGQKDNAMLLPTRQEGDERIRIGLVHGSTFDAGEGWQQNFPIAKDAAIQRGLDYLAIGDTHAFRKVPANAPVPTVYPSTPEATNFGETDTGYVALVFFTRDRRAIVRRERVGHWTWRQQRVTSLAGLRDLSERDLSRTVMRLELDLVVTPEEMGEVEALLGVLKGNEAARGRVGVLQLRRDGLTLSTQGIDEHLANLPEVLQRTAARLRALETEGELAETARRALYHLYRLTRGAHR